MFIVSIIFSGVVFYYHLRKCNIYFSFFLVINIMLFIHLLLRDLNFSCITSNLLIVNENKIKFIEDVVTLEHLVCILGIM